MAVSYTSTTKGPKSTWPEEKDNSLINRIRTYIEHINATKITKLLTFLRIGQRQSF